MAFLRKENKKGKTYLTICESYRDAEGKVQRRVLHNLGNAGNFTTDALERIGRQLIELVKGPLAEPAGVEELCRYNYGFLLIQYHLLHHYGLNDLMNRLTRKHKLDFSLLRSLMLMICDRFNDPLSKLGSFNRQQEYIGMGTVELHHLYRTLDYLSEHNDLIQTHIYNKHQNLFNYELDVVFYDVTTFYFDSAVEQPEALRQMGFSKDGKIGKTQILFSLLIDKNKVPIGFQLFKGSSFEGHTFKDAIEKLKKKYNIKRVIVVADSGMLGKDNVSLFDKKGIAQGLEFIVGERLKNMSAKAIDFLTNIKNYSNTLTITNKEGKDLIIKYCTYSYGDRTIISTYSEKRAAKDKSDREKRIVQAQKMLQQPSLLERKAQRNFLKNTGKNQYELDSDKINAHARFDGFKAIGTNAKDLTAEVVLEKYKDLYKIEQSFRTFKSFLETRPMFHWTDARIEGHMVMCYISFCLLTFLQHIMKQTTGQVYSDETLRKALSKMELSKVLQDKKIFWLRSALTPEAEQIIKALKLKQIPNAVSEEAISNYLPPKM